MANVIVIGAMLVFCFTAGGLAMFLARPLFGKEKSNVVGVAVGVASFFVFKIYLVPIITPLPATLLAANLQGKQWDGLEYQLAARVTARQLDRMAPVVVDGINRHDAAILVPFFDPVMTSLQNWNDQKDSAWKGRYRPCTLAQVQFTGMLVDGNYLQYSAFSANLEACKSLAWS